MQLTRENVTMYGTIAALLIGAAIPFLTDNMFIVNLAVLMLISIIFASAWNLLAYSGQGSLGHAAFFGIGAYASTIIAVKFGITPFVTIFIGAAVAAIIGILIGLTCVRLKEWFLAMVTFGFAIIVQTLTVSVLAPMTGGWDGIPSPRLVSPSVPGYQLIEYYAILIITIGAIVAIWYIMRSKVGLAFLAIRENETEARAAGVDPVRYRLLAFGISAFIAGVAGALQIHHIGYITPELYGVDNSFWPITYVILGGLGTLAGPIVGTVVLTIIWEGLKETGLTFARYVIIGVILILTIIFLPKGLVSLPEQVQEWVKRRKRKEPEGEPVAAG
ncbi:MAG: branched-chain amino acid ABC transporter permease [Methanoregula sp.]|uniref:branched-chain amino acid ABC transporter permease n=1 Tax=Methanoregula sp. TaxID=2052170 RepID=UPI0025EDF2F3|nr:branched-chain amino acid ABC transporter permease [Methanoregula sp.]MCK9632021.1 branched-chain amino acid ABC transporter permease [Methanoregula sp.]